MFSLILQTCREQFIRNYLELLSDLDGNEVLLRVSRSVIKRSLIAAMSMVKITLYYTILLQKIGNSLLKYKNAYIQ